MYNKINEARNQFYAKLIKLAQAANKDKIDDKEILDVLKAQQDLIDTILEFKFGEKISKELESIPCIAEEFVE